MTISRLPLVLLGALLLVMPARAQDHLQSPSEFLGYALGTAFTPQYRVIDYLEHVAAHSPDVKVEQYGTTYEGRPLMLAFVASSANLARLEAIRHDNLRLAGMEEGEVTGDPPAIVWLSYNVHGNESVSTEAAMATLYDLANPENTRTQPWLDDVVVVIDPLINPDGRERYVAWYTHTVGRQYDAHPEAREHSEPWPGGRTNHYYFDLNRDWAWMTQTETQQRLAQYNRWMPHVHVDFHEQGVDSPYYFAPAAEPFHKDISEWQRTFQTVIGKNHTRYFDQNGWLYFTREEFDLFYPGYGDTWPLFNGAVGMTYEQAGHARAGLGIVTAEGDTLSLRERIAHHHTTGLSTVEATAKDRARVVDMFKAYFERARTHPPGTYRTYVVRRGDHPDRVAALAKQLDGQGISYGYAQAAHSARGYHYADGTTGAAPIAPGDLLVSTYQPKSVLATVLFEPHPELVDSLTYDITAWALPYVYDVDAYALTDRIEPDTHEAPPPPAGDLAIEKPYAYLAEWKSVEDVRFLSDVLQAGVKLRFATDPFEIDGRSFAPGTLLLTRTNNEHLGPRFDQAIRDAAAAHHQPLYAVSTGFVTTGSDFGSGTVRALQKTRVAVASGRRVSSGSLGEVWHFFDRQIDYPATLIDTDDLDVADLYDYDVLVLPSGSYGQVFDDDALKALRAWIRDGGRLVAIERAASFLAGKEGFDLKEKKDDEKAAADSLDERLQRYADRDREAVSEGVPGAVYRVQLDDTHPLGFGFGDHYFTLKRGDAAFDFLKDGWNVGVIRDEAPASGFAGYEAEAKLKDTLVFGVQDVGRGSVTYMIDDPLFRGFWYGGKLLFANAVFFVGR